jgi:hypothetical protein
MNKQRILPIIIVIVVLVLGVALLLWAFNQREENNDTTNETQSTTETTTPSVDDENEDPFTVANEVTPTRGANQELYDQTAVVLGEVFDEVKLIEAKSDKGAADGAYDRETLVFIVPRIISDEDVQLVRNELESRGIDITSARSSNDNAQLSYSMTLDEKEYDGTLELSIGETYEWIQQRISLRFTHWLNRN